MILIGLTGGIAVGKSTVSRILAEKYSVPIVDADQIARLVVEPGKTGYSRIRKHFGDEVLNEDKTINRDALARIIFADQSKRKLLNQCLHHLIAFEMFKQILFAFFKGHKFIILDVPLLFETKFALRFITYKVMVDCKEKDEQIRRLLDRNKQLSENDAELRIASQMDRDEKLKLADFIIDNSGDLDGTKSQIKEMFLFLDRSQLYLRIRFGILLIGGLILAKLLA